MANHKSSEKRILVTTKKNAVNTARRSAVKTGKVMPKQRAARKISRLAKKVSKMA